MRPQDIFAYAFSAIKLRKLRAALTTLGIVIGIAAVVALLAISQGLQVAITMQLRRGLAADTLIVTPGGGDNFGIGGGGLGGASSDFNLFVSDTQTIEGIQDVDMSVALMQRVGYIKLGDRTRSTTIVGVDFAKYRDIYDGTFVAESGGVPSNPENNVVAVGRRVVDPWKNGTLLGGVEDAAEIIWVNATVRPPVNKTYMCRVEAVLKEVGGFGLGGPSDSSVYIPISQAQAFFKTNQCEVIVVKLKSDDRAVIDSVSKAIEKTFSNEVTVTSLTAVLSTLQNVFSTLQLFLGGIAAISLIVAGVGIMNIMMVSLMERTREIGILKALGMKSRTVLMVFLSEALIIGLVGAVIGVGSGWSLANLVMAIFSRAGLGGPGGQNASADGLALTPVLIPTVFAGALVFGVVVSVVFALYPAWRASRLRPVDALRYE